MSDISGPTPTMPSPQTWLGPNPVFKLAENSLEPLLQTLPKGTMEQIDEETKRVAELINAKSLNTMPPESIPTLEKSIRTVMGLLLNQPVDRRPSQTNFQALEKAYELIQDHLQPDDLVASAIDSLKDKPRTDDGTFSHLDAKDLDKLALLLHRVMAPPKEERAQPLRLLQQEIILKLSDEDKHSLSLLAKAHSLKRQQAVENPPSLIARLWARIWTPQSGLQEKEGEVRPLASRAWSVVQPGFVWFGNLIRAAFARISQTFRLVTSRLFQSGASRPMEEVVEKFGETLKDFPERYRTVLSEMKEYLGGSEDSILREASFAAAVLGIRYTEGAKKSVFDQALTIEDQLRSKDVETKERAEKTITELEKFLESYSARKAFIASLHTDPERHVEQFISPPIDLGTPKSPPLPEFLGPWADRAFVNLYNGADVPIVEGDEANASQAFAYAMYLYSKGISKPTDEEKDAAREVAKRFSDDIAKPPQGMNKETVVDNLQRGLFEKPVGSPKPSSTEERPQEQADFMEQITWKPVVGDKVWTDSSGWIKEGDKIVSYSPDQFVKDVAERTTTFRVLTNEGEVAYEWTEAKRDAAGKTLKEEAQRVQTKEAKKALEAEAEQVLKAEVEKAFSDIMVCISKGASDLTFVPYVMSLCHQGIQSCHIRELQHYFNERGMEKIVTDARQDREPIVIQVKENTIEISNNFILNSISGAKNDDDFYRSSVKITIDKENPQTRSRIDGTTTRITDPVEIEKFKQVMKKKGVWHSGE